MDAFAEPKFYIVKWKKNGGIVDVLTENQYNMFKEDVELIKENAGYEPTLRIRTAQVYKGKCPDGFCA
jgi:hypothetical protein